MEFPELNNTDDAERVVQAILQKADIEFKEVRAVCKIGEPHLTFTVDISTEVPICKDWGDSIKNTIHNALSVSPLGKAGCIVDYKTDSYQRADGTGFLKYTTSIINKDIKMNGDPYKQARKDRYNEHLAVIEDLKTLFDKHDIKYIDIKKNITDDDFRLDIKTPSGTATLVGKNSKITPKDVANWHKKNTRGSDNE